jgi:hypothetical protein
MERLIIREPYWKYKAFGISSSYIAGKKKIHVVCDYKNKEGNYVYPHVYEIDTDILKTKEIQIIKRQPLYIMPVSEMEVVEYRHADRDKGEKNE